MMPNNSNQLVSKLWNYSNILRDDGLVYGDCVEPLTFLLFMKMADEQAKAAPGKPSAAVSVDPAHGVWRREALDSFCPSVGDTFVRLNRNMSDNSKIEWTDATWNPVRGCTKISPGYAGAGRIESRSSFTLVNQGGRLWHVNRNEGQSSERELSRTNI